MDQVPACTSQKAYNLTLTNINTEYSQVIHDNGQISPSVKAIMFRLQNKNHACQYAFKTGGPYFDLLAGEIYWKDGLDMYDKTLFFQTLADAGAVVDIEVWT